MKHPLALLFTAVQIGLSAAVSAGDAGDAPKMVKIGDKMVPVSQIRESMHRASLVKTGGHVRKANSARGCFVVLNAADFDSAQVEQALDIIDRRAKVQVKAVKLESVDVGKTKDCVLAAGGQLGVLLFKGENAPSLVVAPEDGWAAINVDALRKNVQDEAVYQARVRKEILRAFAFVAGGAYTAKGDFVMRDVKTPRDLDQLKLEDYGIEMIRKFDEDIAFYGVRPWYETTYLKACQEGWAPEPTNEYQRVIWEKVKAEQSEKPTNPIRILPGDRPKGK